MRTPLYFEVVYNIVLLKNNTFEMEQKLLSAASANP